MHHVLTASNSLSLATALLMSSLDASLVSGRSLPLPALLDVRVIQRNYVLSFVVLHALALPALLTWFFSWSGVIAFWGGVMIFGQLGIPICYIGN